MSQKEMGNMLAKPGGKAFLLKQLGSILCGRSSVSNKDLHVTETMSKQSTEAAA